MHLRAAPNTIEVRRVSGLPGLRHVDTLTQATLSTYSCDHLPRSTSNDKLLLSYSLPEMDQMLDREIPPSWLQTCQVNAIPSRPVREPTRPSHGEPKAQPL